MRARAVLREALKADPESAAIRNNLKNVEAAKR